MNLVAVLSDSSNIAYELPNFDNIHVEFLPWSKHITLSNYDGMLMLEEIASEQQRSIITTVRQHPEAFMMPIVQQTNESSIQQALKDLVTEVQKCAQQRAKLTYISPSLSQLEKLAVYAYLTGTTKINPYFDQKNMQYQYALCEEFGLSVSELQHSKLFESDKFVFQNYVCQKCDAAKVLFSESCPTCSSLNLKYDSFLHCFTCGYIGTESEFSNALSTSCPRCLSNLKKFGEDFDRPLDSGVCCDCQKTFIESELKSYCCACQCVSLPEQLKKTIYL